MVDSRFIFLRDALSNPNNVSNLLFHESEVGIKNGKIELVLEGGVVNLDFLFEKPIFNTFGLILKVDRSKYGRVLLNNVIQRFKYGIGVSTTAPSSTYIKGRS